MWCHRHRVEPVHGRMLQRRHTMPSRPCGRRRSGHERRVVHSARLVAELTVSRLRYWCESHPDTHSPSSRAHVADLSPSEPGPQPVASAGLGLLDERSGYSMQPYGAPGAPDDAAVDWRRYWSAIVRYRWWVLLGTGLGLTGGFAAGRLLKPQYRAQATVWIDAANNRPDASRGPIRQGQLLEPYAWVDLLQSYAVLDDAARRLSEDLGVKLDANGNFMRLELAGTDPNIIAAVVNAVAQRLVAVAAELKRAKLTELTRILNDQLATAARSLRDAEGALEKFRVNTITLPAEQSTPVAPGLEATRDPVFKNFFEMRIDREQLRRDREAVRRVLAQRSEEHTSELQSLAYLVCRLLLEKKKKDKRTD